VCDGTWRAKHATCGTVRNEGIRYHTVANVIDWVPRPSAIDRSAKQAIPDRLIEHAQ
jgi:hypothetical protein